MSNDPPKGQAGGGDTDLPEELNEFIDAVSDEDAGGPTRENRDEFEASQDLDDDDLLDDEMDSRVERFGYIAGALVLPVLVISLFVGPWRLFDFSLAAGTIPFTFRDSVSDLVLVAPVVVIGVIGAAVGAVYRATTEDRPEEYRSDIASKVVEVQLIISIVVYLLLVALIAGMGVLDGELLVALIVVVAGIIGLVFFSFFELLAIAIAVGIPAFVGVFVGDLLARIWSMTQT